MTREDIVAEARSWIGTPYRHQASRKGVGCDCLGLIRGVWRAAQGEEPEPVPAYSPDWAEASKFETLAAAASRHFSAVALDAIAPGDVLLFRWRAGLVAKHAAIVTECSPLVPAKAGTQDNTLMTRRGQPWIPACAGMSGGRTDDRAARMVHAHDGAAVTEVAIAPWWRRRLAYAFRWPGVGQL